MIVEKTVGSIAQSLEATVPSNRRPRLGVHEAFHSVSESSIRDHISHLDAEASTRVLSEFHACGPLEKILGEPTLTEIMISCKDSIWIENSQGISRLEDKFLSELTFNNFIHRVCSEADIQTNHESPFADGVWRGFRVHLVSPPITAGHVMTLRRLRDTAISLDQLQKTNWCAPNDQEELKELIRTKQNILVVGNTGSGKTTLLNSLVGEIQNERCVFIEDTNELRTPNSLSVKLLTRPVGRGILGEISQTDLVKQSLRMRPDRLIVGEIRGGEAKDLLMALATGHKGSMASLHAGSPAEGLLRLEMLIQMGAPQWNLDAIRRLIQLTVDRVVVTRKENTKWYLEGIYKISSQEKFGFILEKTNS